MASVKAILKMTSSAPGQTIFVSGLSNPASAYSNFRFRFEVDGAFHHERNLSYYSSSTSFQWYDDQVITSGYNIVIKGYATYNGVEYSLGQANVGRPIITFQPEIDWQAPGIGWQDLGVRNLNNPFNTSYYQACVFNGNGCIEDSTVTPSNIYTWFYVPSPTENTSNTYTIGNFVEEKFHSGEQVFVCVQALNGRWYNLGYTIAP